MQKPTQMIMKLKQQRSPKGKSNGNELQNESYPNGYKNKTQLEAST